MSSNGRRRWPRTFTGVKAKIRWRWGSNRRGGTTESNDICFIVLHWQTGCSSLFRITFYLRPLSRNGLRYPLPKSISQTLAKPDQDYHIVAEPQIEQTFLGMSTIVDNWRQIRRQLEPTRRDAARRAARQHSTDAPVQFHVAWVSRDGRPAHGQNSSAWSPYL